MCASGTLSDLSAIHMFSGREQCFVSLRIHYILPLMKWRRAAPTLIKHVWDFGRTHLERLRLLSAKLLKKEARELIIDV